MRKEVVLSLEELGLSKNDALVYSAVIELGSCTTGDIASSSGLYVSNINHALTRLIQKGLVSYMKFDDVKKFEVIDPHAILQLVKEKELIAERILPDLLVARSLVNQKGQASIFEGVQAFQRILDNFLTFNEPIFVFGIPKEAPEQMKNFIVQYHKRRIAKKIVMKHIYNYDAQERIKFLNSLSYTEAKSLPQYFESNVSTNICGDEVVLVLWTDNLFVIQIKSKAIADSYRKHFQILWKTAKVPK